MLSWRSEKSKEATKPKKAKADETPFEGPTDVVSPSGATSRRLGDMLVKEGVISSGQLEEALNLQAEAGGFLGQVLVDMNFLDQNTLISFLVKQCKIPHISLVDYVVSEDLFSLVPKDLCLKYNLLPIDKLGRILTLAMVDPLDVEALEQVRASCPNLKIKPILCDWNHFENVQRRFFSSDQQEAQEVTAGSFGLTELRTKKKPPASPESKAGKGAIDAAVDALVQKAAGDQTQQNASRAPTALKKPSRTGNAGGSTLLPDELLAGIRASIREPLAALVKELRETAAAQEARVAQATQAALEAARAAQNVVRHLEEDLGEAEGSAGAGNRIANLEVFPGATREPVVGLEDSEALDSPGLGMDADSRVREALDSDQLLSGYTFDHFVVGPLNTFALKAACALGDQLARDFNPFYFFAEEGLGKTHLLNAIGNAVLAKHPDLRVAYVSSSHFTEAHAAAVKRDTVSDFRDRYCRWDMLLIDDVQFLTNRYDAQEELFHIFNALTHEGRIVVMAGDRAPDQLDGVRKGLVSRFSSGIVTRLRPPEMEVRMTILKRHARATRVAVSDDVLNLIATRIPADVRKMTGALRKVIAYAKLVEQDITRDMANEVLASLGIGDAA